MSNSVRPSVLFVLSPLSANFLDTDAAITAAMTLKQQGAARADITMDPRTPVSSQHAMFYPLPDFNGAARRLSESIFQPVVGHSRIVDFSHAVRDPDAVVRPSLDTLSTVGTLFAQSTYHRGQNLQGRNLGLVFYVALHAKTPEHEHYTHLVYPELTKDTHALLSLRLEGNMSGEHLASYGRTIDLNAARAGMAMAHTPQPVIARQLH